MIKLVSIIAALLLTVPAFGADIIPTMTSNTTPSGYVTSSTTPTSGYEAYKAADKSTSTYWEAAVSGGPYYPDWWIELPTPKTAAAIRLTNGPRGEYFSLVNLKLQGSNDGVNYTTILTAYIYPFTASEVVDLSITSPGSYKYYRILDIDNFYDQGRIAGLKEINLFEAEASAGRYYYQRLIDRRGY